MDAGPSVGSAVRFGGIFAHTPSRQGPAAERRKRTSHRGKWRPLLGATGPPTQRDLHVAMVTEHGRLGWQAATGYGTLFRDPGAGVAQPPSTRRAVLQKETV